MCTAPLAELPQRCEIKLTSRALSTDLRYAGDGSSSPVTFLAIKRLSSCAGFPPKGADFSGVLGLLSL